jgi:class 3 adenylate cyclase/WD40 repeat protein/tRNA A-37 threonylcarbamoyl transferase component Bud32/energy-coupling factor transporter ATP-binding protein EcfA2
VAEAVGTPGILLKSRYELLETLGAGGEARVVKALDRQHSRFVALKMRPLGAYDSRDDLLREAKLLLGLTPHPSLPLVREDFFEGDQYVIVMDWVDGTDLGRLVREKGTPGLAPSSVLAYLAEVAEALTFLHTQEPPIIHGDVKPANLILTRGGHVKLVDFGLSSTVGVQGFGRGTAGFLAPELAAGAPLSRASDVYALAATAFALLTGAPPVLGAPPVWEGLEAEQAAQLQAVIAAGLSTDPKRRPATPGELVERLRSGWASTLPTGVMTFCMTDLEGSTMLWDNHPAAMAEALIRHDELIAAIVETHGGRFLKSMGEGDSTTSVFESAAQAVRAAIELTRALADQTAPDVSPLRTRLGLHTGEAQIRSGIYYGPTVNLAARVRGEASGGEILLSEATEALVQSDLPRGYAIVDLGPHHLKGIHRPEVIKALTGPGLRTAPTAAECPYRGLLAFEPHDRHLFFGREEAVADVLARIEPGRLLAVLGASGSGKSSLLRAGVLAAVEAGEVGCARSARLITPGAEPPLELGNDPSELLVVDQLEELYTQCHDGERRSRFLQAVLSRPGAVVIGVRADFYGELSADPGLAGAVAENQVLLGPMRDEDLRRAICEPARLAGLRLEPGLADLVLRDVAGEPGALPLMSHALRETWERRDGRTLTVQAYEDSGGVSSALAQTADAVAAAIPEPDRPLLRNVFLRLTEIGDEVDDTRRRVSIDDLVPQGTSPEAVRTVLELLADARLVTLDEGTAEVAHEVLIRRWPTLRRWLEEDREGLRLHRRLGHAARLWEAAGREPADLYRGTRLDAAVEWAKANGAQLNETERAFLTASVDESAQAHRHQVRINRRLRRALTASAGLLLAALGLLIFALVSRHDAVNAEASARSQAIADEAESQIGRDPQRALLLARAALKIAPTAAAMLATSEALDANSVRSQLPSFGVQGCVTSNYMYLLDRGRIAVDNTCDGQLVFGDLAHRRILKRVRVGTGSTDMSLGASGKMLIVASGHKLIGVDARTYAVRPIFTAPFPIVWTATGSPGRALAIGDADTVATVQPGGRLRVVARGDASANPIIDMLWASPDQLLIETSGQSRGSGDLLPGLTLLNVENGTRQPVPLPVAAHHIAALAFMNVSPDLGTWFVTGADVDVNSHAQVATTWAVDVRTRHMRWIAQGPVGQQANSVNASPDGHLVAVGYSQGSVDVLDATTGQLVVRDSGSASIAAGWMAFPPGDSSLVTVSLDGVFRTWAAQGSEQLRLQAPPDPAVDFTPDGADLVLVGARGELVDWRTGRLLSTFPGFPAASVFNLCSSACFAASAGLRWLTYLDPRSATPRIDEIDGRTGRPAGAVTVTRLDAQGVTADGRIVAAYVDGDRLFALVIDPRSRQIRKLEPGPSSLGCAATIPSFSADGRLMAIVDGCVHVDVWDLRSGRVVRAAVLPDRANASSAAGGGTTASGAHLTPDGRYVLVTVEGGGLVRIELATGRTAERPGAQTVAKALAISPNGRFYALGREDGTVDEYDARSLQLVRHHVLANAIQTLAFSPDSRELAVEDTSNVVWVWDTCAACENPTRLAQLAALQSVRELTPSERATFGVS